VYVRIVSAGVHAAGVGRGKGKPGFLGERQGIHVRPDHQRGTRPAASEQSDHTVGGDPRLDLKSEFF